MVDKKIPVVLFLMFPVLALQAQLPSEIFDRIEIKIDTLTFNSDDNLIRYQGENNLYFQFEENDPTCEVRLFPYDFKIADSLELIQSKDYDTIDSLINFNNQYLRFRVKFRNLSTVDFLNFTFSLNKADSPEPEIYIIPLLPVTKTVVEFYPENTELFIGEEKVYNLITSNLRNIRIDNVWTSDQPVNYRLTEENNQLNVHLMSQSLGFQRLNLKIKTKKPYISDSGILKFDLPVITRNFEVKASRLRFLRMDEEEIILDPQNRNGYEIQLDNSPFFSLQKTYRIEDQEEPGGPLIAEIFTRSYLSNGRILCWFRPYALHRKSDGYLYIKENDMARFITNVDIIPKTEISKISILREGSDWTTDLNVHPGETIDVRIEGKSLHRANFTFEGTYNVSPDSLVRNENMILFTLKVPVDIYGKTIPVYNNGRKTGFSLNVKEYQRPRNFDFVYLEGNGFRKKLSTVGNSFLVDNTLQDVMINFDPDVIDSEEKLYGEQYLNIKITIRGKDNELIEMQDMEDFLVCPGDYSPRSEYYTGNCTNGSISINNHLSKKTYDLDEWSKIIIEIEHDKSKYGGQGYSKRVEIILQKYWRFDIDVSFPAGLLTFGGSNSGNLTGISMAMIAQFSFYEKNKINRFKPYKVGIGFIALDAFNFTSTNNNTNNNNEDNDPRDVAMVILGSLYPTRKDAKLTFPLYFGGGYKLRDQEFFFLVGPGIRIRL